MIQFFHVLFCVSENVEKKIDVKHVHFVYIDFILFHLQLRKCSIHFIQHRCRVVLITLHLTVNLWMLLKICDFELIIQNAPRCSHLGPEIAKIFAVSHHLSSYFLVNIIYEVVLSIKLHEWFLYYRYYINCLSKLRNVIQVCRQCLYQVVEIKIYEFM